MDRKIKVPLIASLVTTAALFAMTYVFNTDEILRNLQVYGFALLIFIALFLVISNKEDENSQQE